MRPSISGVGICPVCLELTFASYCQDPSCKGAKPLRFGDPGYRRLAHLRNAKRAIQWEINPDGTSYCRATNLKAKELVKEIIAAGNNHLTKNGYVYWLVTGKSGKRFIKRSQPLKHT